MSTGYSPDPGAHADSRNQKSASIENANNASAPPTEEHSKPRLGLFDTRDHVPFRTWEVAAPSDRYDGVLPRDVFAALTYSLELVRYGAMLVGAEGRVQLANRAALAILEKKDGLSMTSSGLVADRASDTRLLMKLLHDAVEWPEQGEPIESPLVLPRNKARNSLVVRVVPGPGLECWKSENKPAAIMMLHDQDLGMEVNVSFLTKLYGLTPGEAALAASLIRGNSIEQAAEELFISPHTARTHLKRIFVKTDTHRQTELVVRTFPAVL